MTKTRNSKPYEIGGETFSFSYTVDGKLIGVTQKGSDGKFNVATDLNKPIFTSDEAQEAIVESSNHVKYGGNTESYADYNDNGFADVSFASLEERDDFFDKNKKKFANQQFLEEQRTKPIATASPKSRGFYDTFGTGGFGGSSAMSYPLDLNLRQDHFKIMKYNYQRSDVNASKPGRREYRMSAVNRQAARTSTGPGRTREYFNVAGDGVVGSQLLGSVHLPMPKATDVNGVEWGKSDLTVSGLAAVGAANLATLNGRLSGKTDTERKTDNDAKEAIKRGINETGSSFKEGFGAVYTGTIAKVAGAMFGTDLDANTFLARQGGKVLNPNSEMLFQGPVIRDFAFSFLMVARSEKEGDEIRRIIRFLKLGMAPKFRSTTYLKNPDIFVLEYRRADGGLLDTVNRFNPGGLALTTMSVDYAPNGYWSAYHDSQPVALKMDLNFTELRPIYEQDQIMTPESSVGY